MAGLVVLLLTYYRSPWFYGSLAVAVILLMVATPLMQSHHVLAFSQRMQAREANAEQQQQATQATKDMQAEISGRTFNPLVNPLTEISPPSNSPHGGEDFSSPLWGGPRGAITPQPPNRLRPDRQ
jgi:heme exporter protein D